MSKTTWIAIGTALAIGAGMWIWTTTKTRPRLLMRHFEVEDMTLLDRGMATSALEPCDVFVYGHSGLGSVRHLPPWSDSPPERGVTRFIAAGNEGLRYFNCMLVPLPQWVGGGNRWFNLLDSLVVRQWGAVLADSNGVPLRFFADGEGNPAIIDWSKIGPGRVEPLVDWMLALRGPCRGVFIDQYWRELKYWHIDNIGPQLAGVRPQVRQAWAANYAAFLALVRSRAGATVIANGERTAPPPVYLENSQDTFLFPWQQSIATWRQNAANVLSVDAGIPNQRAVEDSLLAEWRRYGGTIAQTGATVRTQSFYMRADGARKGW